MAYIVMAYMVMAHSYGRVHVFRTSVCISGLMRMHMPAPKDDMPVYAHACTHAFAHVCRLSLHMPARTLVHPTMLMSICAHAKGQGDQGLGGTEEEGDGGCRS